MIDMAKLFCVLGMLLCAATAWADTVSGDFVGLKNITLHFEKSEVAAERAAVVLINGRGESLTQYRNLVRDLNAMGYSVYSYDHRGQGLSGRLLADPKIGHVEHFSDYVADLRVFIENVVNARPHEKRFLLGHSMGGAVAALFARAHPHAIDGLVLSAPMMQINTYPYTETQAYLISEAGVLAGRGDQYVLGKKAHGVSYRWAREALRATFAVRRYANEIKTRTLLLQAGFDKLVRSEGQDRFCSKAPACLSYTIYKSSHAILMENDPIRADALKVIGAFLENSI